MEDTAIIALFQKRSEDAIREVEKKYRSLLLRIAGNIVNIPSDAEECLSDTYLRLWNTIPPACPASLRNFAARITRNAAIDRYRKAAHSPQAASIGSELMEAFSDGHNAYEEAELKALLNGFLVTLDVQTRTLFLRRYWLFEPLGPLAKQMGLKESAVKMRLMRTREKLKTYLVEGGYTI